MDAIKLKKIIVTLQTRIREYERLLKDEKRKSYQLQQQLDRIKRQGQS